MPSKPKTKSKKGKAETPSPSKQPRKAARRAQAAQQELDLGVTEEQFMEDEALSDPLRGMASCLDTMMAMILELPPNVNGQDNVLLELEDTPGTSLSRP